MPPSQPISGTMPWLDLNTENSVLRESNLNGPKPPFWIIVNLSYTFKNQMNHEKQSFFVTISMRKKDVSKPFIFKNVP